MLVQGQVHCSKEDLGRDTTMWVKLWRQGLRNLLLDGLDVFLRLDLSLAEHLDCHARSEFFVDTSKHLPSNPASAA